VKKELEKAYPKSKPDNSIGEVMIKMSKQISDMESALRNIFNNTLHQPPSVNRSGILGNIKIAVGDEKYKEWEEFYE
jgi:hypothetical protein